MVVHSLSALGSTWTQVRFPIVLKGEHRSAPDQRTPDRPRGGAGLRPKAKVGDADEGVDEQEDGAAGVGDRSERDKGGEDRDEAGGDKEPEPGTLPDFPVEERGELAFVGDAEADVGGAEEGRVDGARGAEQGGDRHRDEAEAPERGLGGEGARHQLEALHGL